MAQQRRNISIFLLLLHMLVSIAMGTLSLGPERIPSKALENPTWHLPAARMGGFKVGKTPGSPSFFFKKC